jgi:hypothetical protein
MDAGAAGVQSTNKFSMTILKCQHVPCQQPPSYATMFAIHTPDTLNTVTLNTVTLNLFQGPFLVTSCGLLGTMDAGAAGVQSTNKFSMTILKCQRFRCQYSPV